MIVFALSGSRIHWMEAQPGDPGLLGFILLSLLALIAFFVVRRLSRKPRPFRGDLTKQLLQMPLRRFHRKHRKH
ncbi:MAG: hypothetical protein WA777_16265 [Rhodanobacter sp.]